jgi:hypothetical protein
MAKGGQVYISDDGLREFRPASSHPFAMSDPRGNAPGDIRHVALQRAGDGFLVYYTRIGDRPESILRARVDPGDADLRTWRKGRVERVLSPEEDWEGARLPLQASRAGAAPGRENGVRDPAIFIEDGHVYLLYSVAGESGIAIADLNAPSVSPASPLSEAQVI